MELKQPPRPGPDGRPAADPAVLARVPAAIKEHLLAGETVVACVDEGHGVIVATDWRVLHQRQADRAAFTVTPYARVIEYDVDFRAANDKATLTLRTDAGAPVALRGTAKEINAVMSEVDTVLRSLAAHRKPQ